MKQVSCVAVCTQVGKYAPKLKATFEKVWPLSTRFPTWLDSHPVSVLPPVAACEADMPALKGPHLE